MTVSATSAVNAEQHVVALTEADGGHGHEPELLGLGAEGWVYVGLTIFLLIAIFVVKAPRLIASGLDARIAETRRELDEARAIRAEAEALLAKARAQQAASAGDAAAILAQAEAEAGDLVAKAEADAADLIARRARMAEDKIAAAERAAVAEVRATAADAAVSAATLMITARHGAAQDKPLVDRTIADLGSLN